MNTTNEESSMTVIGCKGVCLRACISCSLYTTYSEASTKREVFTSELVGGLGCKYYTTSKGEKR